MATAHGNPGKRLTFEGTAKSTSWLERNRKAPTNNRFHRRKNSKDVSIELSGLVEEAMSKDPHNLVTEGEYDMLKVLFETTVMSVRLTDSNGASLLHTAAGSNQIEIMQYLIESGAPLNAKDSNGNTPLHVATMAAALEAIHLLLNKRAEDTMLNNDQDAPLHIAFRTGNVNLVNTFLQHETIDLLVPGYRNRTPLHIAAEHDLVDVVAAFNNAIVIVKMWKDKASFRLCAPDSDNLTPIHFAARCGSAGVLRYMMTHCTDHGYPSDVVLKFIDEEESTPMHVAIDAGHVNVLKVLLEFGASPVVQGENQIPPLHLACSQGRLEMVQLMVEHCGDGLVHECTKNGQTPLHWGSRSIHGGKILQYLISKGANLSMVDVQGQTALHYGIVFGSIEAVKELTQSNCDPSIYITDNLGRNVFHHAILHNRTAIVRLLLKLCNASELVLQQDKSGHSSLHYALQNDQENLLLILVSIIQSKILNLKDENSMNYLHTAAKSGNWKALGIILDMPASTLMINEVDNEGSTPLHYAAIKGHLTCIDHLLSHGAMIHKCYRGYTPFLSAVRNGKKECAEALFKAHPFQREWTDDKGNTALHQAVTSGCPLVLKLCLDLGVPISRNELGETFMDTMISKSSQTLLGVVTNHPRLQECLDFPVLEGTDHPFLRLIRNSPDVAEMVLDKCHEKSHLPRTHPNYYESYDFKYLRLDKCDLEEPEMTEKPSHDEDMSEDMMSEASIRVNRNRAAALGNAVIRGTTQRPLEALRTMLICNRVNLLTHPVVVHYLKLKWRGYGRMVFLTQFLLFFLQVALLSLFVILTPPARIEVEDNSYELLSNNVTLSQVSIASNVVRITALFVCSINTVLLIANIISVGLRVINILKYDVIWMLVLSMCASFAFLVPWKYSVFGFKFIYWEAGAIATFTSWFGLVLFVKPFDFFGVYVTMFTEVLSTLIKVLFICVLFLFAFTFPFYILAGDVHPFTTIGDSMFIVFSYILGEINYEYYVRRSENDSLQHPNLTYVFVILAAGLLAVATANFLIGLAVGDIDSIRRNAVVKQRSDEVRIFSRIDVWLPKFIIQKYDTRFHTVHFNAPVHWLRQLWRYFWRALKENDHGDKDVYKLLADQQRELADMRKMVYDETVAHTRQYDELKHLLVILNGRLNQDNANRE